MPDTDISNINQVGFLFTLLMGVLILFLPRRLAVLPIMMTACYVTLGQVINLAALHFTMMRLIIVFGCVRGIIRGEAFKIKMHKIDKVIIAYVIVSASAYILLRNGSNEALINRLGFAGDALGSYFIFRFLIHDMSDIHRSFKMLAFVMVPLALMMLFEKFTGRNLFAILGGVREFAEIRGGRVRCSGSFLHPILAGTFGVTSIPFFIALWVKGEGQKLAAVIGIISATIITIAAASGGPSLAYVITIIGLFMWRYRENMRAIRWGLLIILLSLHLVMKASVWSLIGRVSEITGGGGWHRVELIDAAISHFKEWWLLGTDYTHHWMPTGVSWSEKHTDITNTFIKVGVDGGVFSLILFVAIIVFCYQGIGKKLKEMVHSQLAHQFTLWCLGVSLTVHIASSISVRYFDQMIVFWYLLLSFITAVSMIEINAAEANEPNDAKRQDC